MLSFMSAKKKVLVLDDDKIILELMKEYFLDEKSFELVCVSSKFEFYLRLNEVDAVISDFHMQEITDITFERVKKICAKKGKPLLLLTGDICSYHDFQLSKPFSFSCLRTKIKQMIAGNHKPSSSAAFPSFSNFRIGA